MVINMKIIVAGCGKIGTAILAALVAEGHDLIAVDSDPSVIDEITNVYDVIGVNGNASDFDTLSEAGVDGIDMFLSAMDSDEQNMLSCFLAKKMGAKRTIARIRNPEYNDNSLGFMRKHLELSMAINPELLTANELHNILKFPSAVRIETFSRRNLEMIELILPADTELSGVTLMRMREKYNAKVLVCCVQRGEKAFIPDGNFVLQGGDKIGIAASPAEISKFFKMIGVLKKKAKNIMILGGSRIAYYLAKMLAGSGSSAMIIDQDKQRCEELADVLPSTAIINGNGMQQELLLESGIESADAFVSLTGFDEENILTAIFASMQNVPKAIAKINRDELAAMAAKIGVDTIVSPKDITSSVIVKYARALENTENSKVETLYKLMDGKVEALEFIVNAESKVTGVPLKQLQIKKGILIGGIIRGRTSIIPSGDDIIQVDDRVVVISSNAGLNDLNDILK